jgi:hypothetical protein
MTTLISRAITRRNEPQGDLGTADTWPRVLTLAEGDSRWEFKLRRWVLHTGANEWGIAGPLQSQTASPSHVNAAVLRHWEEEAILPRCRDTQMRFISGKMSPSFVCILEFVAGGGYRRCRLD